MSAVGIVVVPGVGSIVRHGRIGGAAADKKIEHPVLLAPGQQGMTRFVAECLKISDGCPVGGENAKSGARLHAAQHAIGPQHGQWAIQSLHVEDCLAHGSWLREPPCLSKPGSLAML